MACLIQNTENMAKNNPEQFVQQWQQCQGKCTELATQITRPF